MAFKRKIKQEVASYVKAHLPEDNFYQNYFWLISDKALRSRLVDEYKAARYIYKLLEGLQVKDELLVAQCKIQILLCASIYEAVLHHVLLQEYLSAQEVKDLTTYQHRKAINISQVIRNSIQQAYKPVGDISVYENQSRTVDERKIVFEEKAETARKLGLVDQKIKDVICDVYSMRNAIHLHAELRRGVTYDLNAAQKAYWHLQGFTKQIGDKLEKDGKVTRPSGLSNAKKNQVEKTKKLRFRNLLNWFFRE
jgi:hypothetical protein